MLVAAYGQPVSPAEREWGFPSVVKGVECRYMERWLPVGSRDEQWTLRHSYLHLYRHTGVDIPPREIFAFHWEPDANQAGGTGENSQRPHVHVTSAPEPLPSAHLVVTLTVSPTEQSSVIYLNHLLQEVSQIVGNEVLRRMP